MKDGLVKIWWSGVAFEAGTLEEAAQVIRVLHAVSRNCRLVDTDLKLFIAAMKGTAKNEAAKLLGRLGGLKGGAARSRALSPEKLSEIASRAAHARWERHRLSGNFH